MNYMRLSAGESIYVPADSIHAYLSGNIIECMARSNNVLNTGFCPRADRDSIDTFVSTLTFSPHDVEEATLRPKPFERAKKGKTKVYSPPMGEFDMLATELGEGESEVVETIGGPSVMIVTKGRGVMKADGEEFKLSEGFVFFVGAGVETEYVAEEGLQLFRAFAE
jgi:mannose-6-phosphate isomerase